MSFRSSILDLLLPRLCAACGRPGRWLCLRCQTHIEYCLGPAYFREPLANLQHVWCLTKYRFPIPELISQMKFGTSCPDIADWCGEWLADHAHSPSSADTMVTWVPCTPSRKTERGFDQAERIARAFSAKKRLVCGRTLARSASVSQHQLRSRSERRQNSANLFQLAQPPPNSSAIILVDDICTTGRTLSAAATALNQHSLHQIIGLTISRD